MNNSSKTAFEFYMESPEDLARAFVSVYISGMEMARDMSPEIIDDFINDKSKINQLVNSYGKVLMSPYPNYYGLVD